MDLSVMIENLMRVSLCHPPLRVEGSTRNAIVKTKPSEFPAFLPVTAELTQFIWKIPSKFFHKKIC